MPEIINTNLLTDFQMKYVMYISKGMDRFGWKKVTIGWYSNGDKCMIVEDFNGTIYPSEIIPVS